MSEPAIGAAAGRVAVSRASKSASAFRTISEVADELDVAQHVLRFWESKFPQVRPLKRGGGRRYYRPEDVELLRRIRSLLYDEGYTIKGAQKLLRVRKGADDDESDRPAPDRPPRRSPSRAATRSAEVPSPVEPAADEPPPHTPTRSDAPNGSATATPPSAPLASSAPPHSAASTAQARRRLLSLRSELSALRDLLRGTV